MNDALKIETECLTRSWMQHEPAWLRDYLVSGVEDPRINLQSIFTRHFLIRVLFGEKFGWLFDQECRFSAAMNWLLKLARTSSEPEEFFAVLQALRRGLDNAEGIHIPGFILHLFQSLPASNAESAVPNYIQSFVENTKIAEGCLTPDQTSINSFAKIWSSILSLEHFRFAGSSPDKPMLLSVLEPGCGSANDYRFLDAYGIARFLNYSGLELCPKNVENARSLFPHVRFEHGNVFELSAVNAEFDVCFFHDLLEHFSGEALPVAISEICRVTRTGISAGFFNMDEIDDHVLHPVDDYHWNTLSLKLVRDSFARHGFASRAVHVDSFLRQELGCPNSHNPNAYTIFFWRTPPLPTDGP